MVTELLLPKRGIAALELPSYIKFDGAFALGEGTLLGDKSRYRSHGTISGATWAAGLHGYCLDFDKAIPDYVEIPASHTQLNFTSEDFSIICRVRATTFAGNVHLYNRGLDLVDGYYLSLSATARLDFVTSQAPVRQISTSLIGSLVINTWYTLGMSRSGASVRVYINGVDSTTTIGVHINPLTCARSLKIGIYDNLVGSPLDGKIEFLRIFGGIALSASEHLAYHNALA